MLISFTCLLFVRFIYSFACKGRNQRWGRKKRKKGLWKNVSGFFKVINDFQVLIPPGWQQIWVHQNVKTKQATEGLSEDYHFKVRQGRRQLLQLLEEWLGLNYIQTVELVSKQKESLDECQCSLRRDTLRQVSCFRHDHTHFISYF